MNSPIEHLTTEQPNQASQSIDRCSTIEALRIVNSEDNKVAAAVAAEIPNIARAVDAIVAAMERGGRLFYLGAGTSGRLGVMDAVECVPTFNCNPDDLHAIIAGGTEAMVKAVETVEDRAELGASDLLAAGFTARDVLVANSSSGRTPYVLGAVGAARQLVALTIGITCNASCDLVRLVDVAIVPQTGPEVILGSTRLKAGTATKMVLNMISTIVMAQRGHVFRNFMVNVNPTNSKLLERARATVAHILGVEGARAAELLASAGGSIKTAVLMGRLSLSREEAQRRLELAGGRLSEILED